MGRRVLRRAVGNSMTEALVSGSLSGITQNQLTCLCRHWAWADDAMARFEREQSNGRQYDDDPHGDRLFGAYYHWCALLCGFSEAALDHRLLTDAELRVLRNDLEVSLPGLRTCRQLLVVIPTSREEHPRIVDRFAMMRRSPGLRRLHHAFGNAFREAQMSREIDLLNPMDT